MARRNERVSKLIRSEISELLEREINDPRLSGLISVTDVSLSPDFKHAKVFISVLGTQTNRKETIEAFDAASGFLRRELASRLKLRNIPQLSFHYDDSIERGAKLLELIAQVNSSK